MGGGRRQDDFPAQRATHCRPCAPPQGWSYGVDGAGCETQPLCWLKADPGSWSSNPCRIAGDMGLPGGVAKRPAINGNFTFLAGFLDQSWWSDGEVGAGRRGK